MPIELDGEKFSVSKRRGENGQFVYDFLWTNGPNASTYGFTFSPAEPAQEPELEREARNFVRAFFSPDGIGPSDFPDFVASRKGMRS